MVLLITKELEMITFKDYDVTEMASTVKEALHRVCEGKIPTNLLLQHYVDPDEIKEGWVFFDDDITSDSGFACVPLVREIQLLDMLILIEKVESLELYEDWLEKTANELERNWDYRNSIYVSKETYPTMDSYYGVSRWD